MTNMYSKAKATWNPFVGCEFNCSYCKPSFQAQAKRQRKNCMKCYDFEPHEHPERLTRSLPKTGPGEFIFVCSMGDISFASKEYRDKIIDRIAVLGDRTFLLQSKDPACFIDHEWPNNVILGTTIETNCEFPDVSAAPGVWTRLDGLHGVCHHRKMVTIEPIIDFGELQMLHMMRVLAPEMIWIGYDSRKTGLKEPALIKTVSLIRCLRENGHTVFEKTMREAL